jgi:hypothetical protein
MMMCNFIIGNMLMAYMVRQCPERPWLSNDVGQLWHTMGKQSGKLC